MITAIIHFNPRPREEGDIVCDSYIYGGLHFNPRPREEGDPKQIKGGTLLVISIHALVKRATVERR